jgi:osmoprotectant transport system substrate-binding protein
MHEAPKRHTSRLVAVFAVLAMIVAACGDDGGADDPGNGEGEAALDEFDFSGITISVGSKDFDEQLVLGHLIKETFEYMGATVEDNIDLGGTEIARAALVRGDIDTYMEYNGTGYAVHLGIPGEVPDDPDTLTGIVAEQDLEENEIRWLGRAPFNNTYGFVSSPGLTEAEGAFDMQGMADYLEANPDTTVCMESEFPNRDDGLILFEEATGYTVPQSQTTILDTGLIYTQTADDTCDFGEVFTTDGRIEELGLTLVDDPGVMILYNISMNLRDDKYQESPDEFDAVADLILNPLTQERMVELNYRLSALGDEPAVIARDYLIEEGLIEE